MYFAGGMLPTVLRETFAPRRFEIFHAALSLGLLAAFAITRGFVCVGRAMDHVLWPSFRSIQLPPPVFILGSPRSGTTLLHNLFVADPQFSSMRLYESVFPSITLLRTRSFLRKMRGEKRSSPLPSRLIEGLFSGWRGIHAVRMESFEEDEQLFVYAFMSPVLALLLPTLLKTPEWAWVDRCPASQRTRLMKHYLGSLKRHVHVHGADKTLLVKNTGASGRLQTILEALPDSRIVHVVRHPYEAVSSLLSMYATAWKALVPAVADNPQTYRSLADLYMEYYRYRADVLDRLPASQVLTVDYRKLTSDPESVVREAYHRFGFKMSSEAELGLKRAVRAAGDYHSVHSYSLAAFGMTARDLFDRYPDVFERYGFGTSIDQRRFSQTPELYHSAKLDV